MLINKNKVAILMATYNGEQYIEQQIDSIIAQSYTNWSLYIRDDGSSDSTCQILDKYQSKYNNIFILKDTIKLGAKLSFIKLLESVYSEYYMFADQDDYWLKDKIEIFVEKITMTKYKNKPVIVCSDLKIVDENLKEIYPSFWKFSKFKQKDFNNYKFHWFWNNINGCSMLINNSAKNVSLPIPKEAFMHDSWIALSVLSHNGVVLPIHNSTILYRQHQSNTVGARRDNAIHYFTNIKEWTSRTHNQYLTIRKLHKITFVKFVITKILLRTRQIFNHIIVDHKYK